MKQGIIVVTWSGGEKPARRLLESIWNTAYPVAIVLNDAQNTPPEWFKNLYILSGEMGWHLFPQDFDGYEIGAIERVLEETDWEEFILLFDDYVGKSVAYNPHFQMYLGKYRREIFKNLTLPIVRNKIEAVRQEELFTRDYWNADPSTVVFNPQFKDENFYHNWEDEFERKNLKLEDEYIIKRKGTWDAKQLV
jgi:hypothetical protein